MINSPALPDRFWAKVQPMRGPLGTPCWLWTGALDPNDYGQVGWECRTRQAHIIAYTYLTGAVPWGLDLDHLCRVRPCVHPLHLEPVTRRVNLLRGVGPAALNYVKTECDNGHEFTVANTYIRPDGTRKCRTCHRDAERERYRQRKVAT